VGLPHAFGVMKGTPPPLLPAERLTRQYLYTCLRLYPGSGSGVPPCARILDLWHGHVSTNSRVLSTARHRWPIQTSISGPPGLFLIRHVPPTLNERPVANVSSMNWKKTISESRTFAWTANGEWTVLPIATER
jgi:hypothetical protein